MGGILWLGSWPPREIPLRGGLPVASYQRSPFLLRWGFTTAERRHRCYNFSTDCVTSWHAPVWPFEISKLGTAMIGAMRGTHAAAVSAHLRPAQFHALLAGYARMHVHGAAEDVPAGEPFVGESFHGDDGYWLTRRLMHQLRPKLTRSPERSECWCLDHAFRTSQACPARQAVRTPGQETDFRA